MIVFGLVVATILFAVLHSMLARLAIKARIRQALGERRYEGLYRLGYNFFAVLTLLPVVLVLMLWPGAAVWTVDGWVSWLLRGVQLIGLIGLTMSVLQIEGGRFLGTSQLAAYMRGEPLPLPDEPLTTSGVYGWVRHPLYFFSLLLLWFTPQMTTNWLVFVVLATIYFLVGSLLEERTMVEIFGEQYEAYRQRVPWMVPFIKVGN